MSSRRVEGRSYGQRVPPLTSVIKSILERYPDGGQILKEIIQNADDASATTVSFLLDSRGSPYGKSSLYNDELAKFQGPALYSFNNARFKEEDWEGLQSLMDSNKKKEPLKVGRFGIGFNSIYHVTDLPSVVSGQLLAFLDPHEVYFGKRETGRQFDLQEPLIHEFNDQFSPFEDVLGCNISSQFVNGTLFRFPLRTEASELSKKPYTTDKVRQLFQSLKDEASLILLFLKNIEEISLYETDEHQREKLVFRVRLDDCCRKRVREQRRSLLAQVPDWESGRQTVLQLDLEMAIEIFDIAAGTRQEKWITHNRIGDKQANMRERALRLHLLPWVGFAAPLSVAGGRSTRSNGGRIFCFLPLPPDADAKTGYPVHIHGYFGLTDNRRGLKWPGPECQNDDMAEWNVDLMTFVGCQAYARLLQTMTTRMPVSPDMISIFYQCWPDKKHVNKHWKDIIDQVYELLLSERVFWTWSNKGQWLSLNQAVLERLGGENLSAETKTVINKVLHLANEPVVSLPFHVDEYVRIYASSTRLVSPKYLRAILKQNRKGLWNMKNMSRGERIAMLEYIVTDKNFADFEGIALLPLVDGSFTAFKAGKRCGPKDVVYVETQDNRMTLLPGMESRFLDTKIKGNVLLSIARTAVEGNKLRQSYFQLVRLNPRSVINLLRQVLPKNLFLSDPVVWNPLRGNHPSEAWLVDFWKWLMRTFPDDLTQLEGFPLIKCSSGQYTALAKLKRDTKTIRQKSYETGISLPKDVVSLLKTAEVVVLPEVPYYMMQHACFSMYVADASPEGVLKVLRNVGIQRSIAAVIASNVQEKKSLRVLLSSLRVNLSNDEKHFMKSLPIFEAIDQNSFIDAQNKPSTAPRGFASQITLKIKNASCILSVEDDGSNQLLKALNIPEMTMGQFLTREIFPHLSLYTTQQITSLMCWALRRIDVFRHEEPNFCSDLANLNFVDAGQGRLLRPQDLFDPNNELNKRLLEGEESKFPVGEFAKDDVLLPLRNHLGLKETLDYIDVANLAMNLHNFDINRRRNKAIALIEFLGNNPSFLRKDFIYADKRMMLQDFLGEFAWVPCAVYPPGWYPKCMPWKSVRNGLSRPQEVVASQYGGLVGSVMSVLQCEPTSLIKSGFGWDHPPDGSKVFEQLEIACGEIDVNSLQGKERERFWRMLKSIYEALAENDISDYYYYLCQSDFAWIWNGQGFSSPRKIAFKRRTNFDLEPYLHIVPKEMQEGELCGFFPKFGVKAFFTEDNLLDVLLEIKVKHDNADLDRGVIAKDKQLALDILHWIVREGPLKSGLRDKVYVPVMKGPGILNLVPLTECTFCDADWLRGNFLELQLLPELPEFSLIDESISNTTASHLGVPPMSRCVTAPEALGFEQAGPYEPITRRLKNILDEYKEGAGVFKELIQNADDARATEVKFLVDWRQHPVKKLLAEGMKESQGPALLAYNNAVFTKDDFENINKLAGATKKEDLDKIGRFGLGFNSVYHFTDTPSFVSSNYAVFFDPDTKHLGHLIRNPSQPGIKLNLADNRHTLLCYPDQFQPYQGVFDCEVNGDTSFDFDGTLFRFPFRRGPSEICDKQYNERDVRELLESFNRSASSLLLNTQNVEHVSVWELDPRAKEPSDMQMLTKVERKILSDSGGSAMTTFLHDCAIWSSNRDQNLPQRTKIISLSQTMTDVDDEQNERTEYWLQCDRMGDAESLEMATSKEGKQKGLLSCAGVAVNLNASKDSWEIKDTDGEAFCFLPLSIPTGLPVHVNGYFAVTSNRRGIWEQTAEESQYFQPVEARWNKALMKDGIAQAYLELLKEAKRMTQEGNLEEYSFCSLWPNPDCLQSQVWKPLIIGVYTLIASSSMKLLKSGEDWHSVTECIFPDDELKKIPGCLDILHGCNIVDLPKFARNGFCAAGCGDQIKDNTLTQEAFLTKFFFPNMKVIRYILRNKVVCHIIDECLSSSNSNKEAFFEELLSSNACIPCSADHQVLARPRDLVHPRGAAASLYSPCDNKMPVGDCFLEPKRLLELQNCGMAMDVLNWDQILERAKSVKRLDYDNGLKRISALVHYLNQVIDQMPPCTSEIRNKFASLPIFPIMAKPKGYMFPWNGDIFDSQTMLPSTELFGQEYVNVIGALGPVLDESEETGCGRLNQKVRRLFRLSDRKPSLENAINQLQIVYEHFQKSKTSIERVPLRQLNGLCENIYKFLDNFVGKKEEATLIARLKGLSWILVEDHFVKSTQLAFKWNGNGAPYLYRVPTSLANSRLLVAVGVKATFDVRDFLSALNHMKAAKKDERLDDAEFKVSKVFLDELNGVLDKIPKDAIGCTPIPDRDRVLRPARELVINDTPWMVMDKEMKYVHNDISINLAHALGARDIRSKSLEDISRPIGQPFGQNEPLTDRLANILKSYPCDFGILKELLQNADDAKATEIHFVYDPRQHGKERLFSDSWKELQGPALCVYNNRPFSEKDLEGIQRLGIGSKADSPEKTGQYGIGFNAVYHLTDCPSFITDGNTLCILDPHARYAPGATKDNPGRLIGPFDKIRNFQENYRDVFPGYLGDKFDLKGSTMFRFPLRNKVMASKSDISQEDVPLKIKFLLEDFEAEAKETLLFLNYVKKISISKIEDDELKLMYEVSADLKEEDENKRRALAAHVKNSKHLPTSDIERFGIFYPMTLKDNFSEQNWLVYQTIGVSSQERRDDIPDGKHHGLLPRAGVAAKVTAKTEFREGISSYSTGSYPERRRAFCFLPLPVTTGLPLHVNGHFTLDSGRRHLWKDDNKCQFRSKWNKFIKTEIIADAYVSLLFEARGHIPYLKREEQFYFSHTYEANYGLQWFEGLLPSQSESQSEWEELVFAVLNKITHSDKNVLPLLQKVKTEQGFKNVCRWLSPSEGFFPSLDCDRMLSTILRKIGFNLVYLQHRVYENFRKAKSQVKEVAPKPVLKFLSSHEPILEQLPCPIGESSMESAADVIHLIEYCMKSPSFVRNLDGVPLLLTRDGILRPFSKKYPVYVSKFSPLVQSPAHHERFAANEIVTVLQPVCEELFLHSPPVVLPLNLSNLVNFFPFIFQEHEVWFQTSVPIPWTPDGEDREIKKWLTKLWFFISKEHKANPSDRFLEPLRPWPVIPTTSGFLLPVSLSKTVLDLTKSDSWSYHQTRIVHALKKLLCPEVDMELMKLKGASVSDVVKTYLAYPNSVNDVITVLDSLMEREEDISGRVDADTANLLLQFLKEDPKTLQSNARNVPVLRKLPFYKTIDGQLIKLEGATSVCKVSPGIPLEESSVWMEGTKNIFLEPCPPLDVLHKMLGVELKSHVSCYIDFIFPKFSLLREPTRLKHLLYIRDKLFYMINGDKIEVARLESALKKLKFIPNVDSGDLHATSYYYDPRNPVFKAMLSKSKFPGKPFCKSEWNEFLCRIGLQTTFTKDQFLAFAREIEKEAEHNVTNALLEKSKVLTGYLLQEESLHEANFLAKVSAIKFVAAYKAEEKFNSLVKQHLFEEKALAPLVSFRNALPRKYEILVWASAALLPDWALPGQPHTRRSLGILEKPTLQQVKNHVQRLCSRFNSKDIDLKEPVRKLLLQIMSGTYAFLKGSLHDSNVHQFFHGMPLILVEDGRVFVRCEQLAFEMQNHEEQPPYLYKVPREFGQFESLFKHLGAFEKPCPSQYAHILQILWKDSKGEEVHPEEMRHVKNAVRGLFRTLKRLHKDDERNKTTKCLNSLKDIETLYLPTEKKQLKPSNHLYYVNPHLLSRIDKAEFNYDVLYDLMDCGLLNDSAEDLLGFLPLHLQVTPLTKLLVEELHPDCFDRKCKMDESGKCSNAGRLRSLLDSHHLIDGIIRILKFQNRSMKVDDEVRKKVESLRNMFIVVCFESLETVLKNDKDEEARGSKFSKSYFAKEDGEKTCIFIQHGARSIYSQVSYKLSLAVNKHIGNTVNQELFAHLEFIIFYGMIRSPAEIHSILDNRGIEPDKGELTSGPETSFLGSPIPEELHYLLVQFEDILFRPEEIVGYEKEDNSEEEQGEYCYARIVRETSAPNPGGKAKKPKRDPTTGRRKTHNSFLRKYLIDIGTGENIEVVSLDLYKLKRPEELTDSNDSTTDMSDSQTLVPYDGEEQPTGSNATTKNSRPDLPRTWEKAKKEVDKALADIMKLPKEQRKKAVKRLYLRWHPDKNPDMEELATEGMKYIQNEFQSLSEGRGRDASKRDYDAEEWETSFRKWDQRARRQRASYDNYRRSNPGFTRNFSSTGGFRNTASGQSYYGFGPSENSGSSAPFGQRRNSYHAPDPKLARIWLIQSRSDLESVKHLFSAKTPDGFYWLICFQCNQVVEKALKAALYSVSGISNTQLDSHDLTSLAYDLRRLPRAPDVIHSVGKLWSYHDATRYPHKHRPAKPPKEVYTFQQAQEAYDIAKSVLKALEEFIGILHL